MEVLSGGHSDCIKDLEAGRGNLDKLVDWITLKDSENELSLRAKLKNWQKSSNWRVKVFHFEDYWNEDDYFGKRFAGYLLNSLIQLNLNAEKTVAKLEYIPTRGMLGADPDWKNYVNYMPFIAVIGHIDRRYEGDQLLITVRVATVQAMWKEVTVMVEEVHCSTQPDEMRKTAHTTAEKIRSVIVNIVAEYFKDV